MKLRRLTFEQRFSQVPQPLVMLMLRGPRPALHPLGTFNVAIARDSVEQLPWADTLSDGGATLPILREVDCTHMDERFKLRGY